MKKTKSYSDELLIYVLKRENDSYAENPFKTDEDNIKLTRMARKKLNELTENYLNEVKK